MCTCIPHNLQVKKQCCVFLSFLVGVMADATTRLLTLHLTAYLPSAPIVSKAGDATCLLGRGRMACMDMHAQFFMPAPVGAAFVASDCVPLPLRTFFQIPNHWCMRRKPLLACVCISGMHAYAHMHSTGS
jgi:hypothetical protein